MAEFDEEDELTKLKQWWANNGRGLMIGVTLGLLVVAGWYAWHWYQNRQAKQAAQLYSQVSQAFGQKKLSAGAEEAIKSLKNDYTSTPYATSAALALGRYRLKHGDNDKAITQFAWAVKHAPNAGIRALARARQARAIWNSGHADKALALLRNAQPAPGFTSLYDEIEGDILVSEHKRSDAHAAYKKALATRTRYERKHRLQAKLKSTATSGDNSTSASSS